MNARDQFKLNGKTAFVTGGAKGIGRSIAYGLCEAGSKVAIVDIDEKRGEQTNNELRKAGYETIFIKTNVTIKREIDDMITKILETWGRIDIAVNNAGMCINAPAEEMKEQEWDAVINLNLKGVFLCSQAVGRVMIKQRNGSIINIASMSGQIVNHPQPQVAYNVSKAGVIMLTRSMAVEWAKYGVRVNSVSPGYTATDLLKPMKELHSIWKELTPFKRFANPDEIKGPVVFLASDASSFVTGHNLIVDGGYSLW